MAGCVSLCVGMCNVGVFIGAGGICNVGVFTGAGAVRCIGWCTRNEPKQAGHRSEQSIQNA